MKTMIAMLAMALVLMAAPTLADNHTLNTSVNTTVEANASINMTDNQTETEINGSADADAEAGVTPDSIFYGLDVAIDRLRINLERNPEKRAERALKVAEERLQEVRVMIEEKRENQANKAQQRYNQTMEKVEQSIADIETDDNESVNASAEARAKVDAHFLKVAAVHKTILERQKERMTEEQINHLESIFARMSQRAEEAKAKAEIKSDQARARTKARLNITDDAFEKRFGMKSPDKRDKTSIRADARADSEVKVEYEVRDKRKAERDDEKPRETRESKTRAEAKAGAGVDANGDSVRIGFEGSAGLRG